MQPYQNYYQAPMPMYQNSYPSPMMSTSNIYLDRLSQMQAQQNLNTFSAFGKIVESKDIVKATDIPMDGNIYYFPKADGTEVYGKRWLANGQTQILAFKQVLDDEPSNSTNEDLKAELGALDELKTTLKEWMESVNTRLESIENTCRQNATQKPKKGVTENAEQV